MIHDWRMIPKRQKRRITVWHMKLFAITPVTNLHGWVPGQKDLCSLGAEDSSYVLLAPRISRRSLTPDHQIGRLPPHRRGHQPNIYVYVPSFSREWYLQSTANLDGTRWPGPLNQDVLLFDVMSCEVCFAIAIRSLSPHFPSYTHQLWLFSRNAEEEKRMKVSNIPTWSRMLLIHWPIIWGLKYLLSLQASTPSVFCKDDDSRDSAL